MKRKRIKYKGDKKIPKVRSWVRSSQVHTPKTKKEQKHKSDYIDEFLEEEEEEIVMSLEPTICDCTEDITSVGTPSGVESEWVWNTASGTYSCSNCGATKTTEKEDKED